MPMTHLQQVDQYEDRLRDAWRAVAAVLDDPHLGSYGPQRNALEKALRFLAMEVGCGDCVEGRCHWGGDRSRESIAAAQDGREYADPTFGRCGCARHEFSVEVRERGRAASSSTNPTGSD